MIKRWSLAEHDTHSRVYRLCVCVCCVDECGVASAHQSQVAESLLCLNFSPMQDDECFYNIIKIN